MTLKSKLITVPTVLILAVVFMIGMKANKAGKKKSDKINQVGLTVTLSPSPRYEPLYVDWFALPQFRNDIEVNRSPWMKFLIVERGTLVKLVATQISPGRLTCSITRNGIVASTRTIQTVGKVECETVVE